MQALEPQFYAALLTALGLNDDPGMQAQHDARQWSVQTARLGAIFLEKSRAYWTTHFDGSDACVAAVLPPQAAAEEPHMKARNVWDSAQGYLQAAPAPRFDGHSAPINIATRRDADRAAILAELDL